MTEHSAAAQESNSEPASGKHRTINRRKEITILLVALALGFVLLVAVYAVWNYDRHHPSTDDAVLKANFVWITTQVDGQISSVSVKPNEFVQASQTLFQIDPRPFQERLTKAKKQLILVRQQNVANIATVKAAEAQITEQQAALKTAEQYAQRYKKMEKSGAASKLGEITYENSLVTARAKLLELQSDLTKAVAELGADDVQQARIQIAEAAVTLAQLELDWTTVTAPADGTVTGLTLRAGDYVQAGRQLFPFIESAEWWVQANFKETQIEKIRPGQPATIKIDIYGDKKFHGIVDSVSTGSAAAFSLLPPQNTTGNWVKVTQRIPVRIRLSQPDPDFPYRYGASAEAAIDTEANVPTSNARTTGP
jgi:membrane fusion protein (multidrug efflux system)